MKYSILTSTGWRKFKNLSVGIEIYTIKNRTLVLETVDSLEDVEDNFYRYTLSDSSIRYAFGASNIFDVKKSHKFSYLIGGDFNIPLKSVFVTDIKGIEKSTDDIIDAVKKKITYSWVRKLCREDTERYLKEWEKRYNGLKFTSDKQCADLQILLARLGKLSYVDGNEVVVCSKNTSTKNYEVVGKIKTKLPKIDGELANFIVRDENRNVYVL